MQQINRIDEFAPSMINWTDQQVEVDYVRLINGRPAKKHIRGRKSGIINLVIYNIGSVFDQ